VVIDSSLTNPRTSWAQDYGVESYLGVDSLGFQMAKNEDYDLEERVRDNSYVLFLIGIFIDHAYFCFAHLEEVKTCHKLTDVASQWVIDVTMVRLLSVPLGSTATHTGGVHTYTAFRFSPKDCPPRFRLSNQRGLPTVLLGSFPCWPR
jgi:hypothetical protein